MVTASRGSWPVWVLRTAAALAGGERTGPCAAPRRGSFAFAIAAIGELMAKPAGAAGVAVVPAHRDLVLGTPARVLFVRRGGALGVRLRRGVLAGPIAAGRRLRLPGHPDRRGDLLVQRPGLGLTLLLGLLAGALGLLLTGGEVGFAAVQDVLEPGQAHGGPALELQVVHVPHGQHELHVADLELDVERGGRFADGPACRSGCGGGVGGGGGSGPRWGGVGLLRPGSAGPAARVGLRPPLWRRG